MKIRMRGNSVRVRLTRGEVARLAAEGRVEEATEFGPGPGGRLVYSLESSDEARGLGARFSEGRIRLTVPADAAERWAASDEVSLESEQQLGVGPSLRILVEKDFACLTKRAGEEDADTYPHPQEGVLAC
jgi:hypothetical protein